VSRLQTGWQRRLKWSGVDQKRQLFRQRDWVCHIEARAARRDVDEVERHSNKRAAVLHRLISCLLGRLPKQNLVLGEVLRDDAPVTETMSASGQTAKYSNGA
jgi:hypothetical protein